MHLIHKNESYKNITIPIIITTLFGLIITVASIFYSEIRANIYDKFIAEINKVIAEHGYSPNDLVIINNDEIQQTIATAKMQIVGGFIFLVLLILICGYAYYEWLKKDYKFLISRTLSAEYEVSLIDRYLDKKLSEDIVQMKIENGNRILTYGLLDVCER